jgi:hypothetical protein
MGPHGGGAAAWRAFDRVLYEILRHRKPRVP